MTTQKKNFPKVKAASKLESIPFVSAETLTAEEGYLVSEAGIANIEAALTAAEGSAALQANLDTANQAVAATKLELATAQTDLANAKTELGTAKTDLTAAQADAAKWKAKAIEFGAKSADPKNPVIPAADSTVELDETEKILANLSHNQRADRLLS